MANYLSYGFSAYEIEVKYHIIRRVFFAISVADSPGWLSWYFFSQSPGLYVVDFQAESTADSTRKIGSLIDGLAGQHFTFAKNINVNAFANTYTMHEAIISPATCTLKQIVGSDSNRKYLDCRVIVTNKLGQANIHFRLLDEGGMLGLLVPDLAGHLAYVGSVDLRKQHIANVLARGPVVASKWLRDAVRPDI